MPPKTVRCSSGGPPVPPLCCGSRGYYRANTHFPKAPGRTLTDYDLQGLRDHRKLGGIVPYDLPVNCEFQASGGSLDLDYFRPSEEDSFYVQVVRVGQNRGGELEHLPRPDVFYDHEVQEPVLGIGSRGCEPAAAGVAAVAYRQIDRANVVLRTVQRQRDLLCAVTSRYLERGTQVR